MPVGWMWSALPADSCRGTCAIAHAASHAVWLVTLVVHTSHCPCPAFCPVRSGAFLYLLVAPAFASKPTWPCYFNYLRAGLLRRLHPTAPLDAGADNR